MRPIVLYRTKNAKSREIATAVALAIGAEAASLGDSDSSDFWVGLARTFDIIARSLPDEESRQVHENFDLVVVGDTRLASRLPGADAYAAVAVRVFLRFRDESSEPLGLFVTYGEDVPTYPGQPPVPDSVTVARGLLRITYALTEAGEGALLSPEAAQAVETALRLHMVDKLV